MADNYKFELASEGFEHFGIAMALAFAAPHRKATHYRVDPDKGLVLYWCVEKGAEPLPYEMNASAATGFAWGWLATAKFPPEPDHDGFDHKGFRVFNEEWCRIDGTSYGFVAIRPEWQMYGK